MIAARKGGFSLVEMLVVLTIVGIGLAMATTVFDGFLGRAAARNAGRLFSQDLAEARSFAARTRTSSVIRFDESSRAYRVAMGNDTTVRDFGPRGDFQLSALDLDQNGDSLAFDRSGAALLTVSHRGLGRATFMTRSDTVVVHFNALGTSRLEEVR